ncbi:MAG TPA: S53 family peptidase [Candidatus Dormibacteraeota bacterium]|jgi:subtilase family serine protease
MGPGSIRRTLISGAVAAIGAASALPGIAAATQIAGGPIPIPAITGNLVGHLTGTQVPTTAQCEAAFGFPCFSGTQLADHYGLPALWAAGLNGKGKTIVIVDSYGSPTIQKDLQTFDKALGLPNPSLSILQPVGAVPPFDPNNGTMVGWAEETSLDVEMSHAIAPAAKIILVETPVAETEGVTGFPQMIAAENFVINHHLGDVISQSFGATEETFSTKQSLLNLRSAYKNAAAHNVTVLASSGDFGATNAFLDGSCCYAHRVNSWPSSDPLVTSLGGTQVHANASGTGPAPVAKDTVWNDPNSVLDGNPSDPTTCCAGGGGKSVIFSRPAYQNAVAHVTGAHRGTPDISMSSAVDGAALVYLSFHPLSPGWYLFGGTSEASPLFAGIVAIADQAAGHDLGLINSQLYAMSLEANPASTGIVDVTKGNNSFVFDNGSGLTDVVGFHATGGYDLASGVGTIWAPLFVHSLAS